MLVLAEAIIILEILYNVARNIIYDWIFVCVYMSYVCLLPDTRHSSQLFVGTASSLSVRISNALIPRSVFQHTDVVRFVLVGSGNNPVPSR